MELLYDEERQVKYKLFIMQIKQMSGKL